MRFTRGRIDLVPTHQITVYEAAGHPKYESDGDDPRFELLVEGAPLRISPGWYRIRLRVALAEGSITSPCLYPDFGEGMYEAQKIPLPEPDGKGWIETVVAISRPVHRLRFDPTIRPARFSIDQLTIRNISRPRAFLLMLAGIQRARKQLFFDSALAALWGFLRLLVLGRMTEGAQLLVRHYVDACREDIRGYTRWVALFDNTLQKQRRKKEVAPLARRPLISVIVPTYHTPLPLLRKCIDSVIAQTYSNWQLCIADDASPSSVRKLLAEYARQDSRILLHLRENRGHISETSNDALALATGDFVAFLDHDDELTPDALFEVARAIEHNPLGRLFYSDEDKIDEGGKRFDPNFKPAWNPELLRSQNYICHLTVLDAALVSSHGGLRRGFEGAQDHDLLLRCTERLLPSEVVHIPKVLYHWRQVEGSTAAGVSQKSYALETGRRAVESHMARIGIKGRVEVTPAGYYRARRELGDAIPRVAIIIPSRDKKDLLATCVDSILQRTTYGNYRVIVVDNGSEEAEALAYLAELEKHEWISVLRYPAPFNFSAIINHAARHAEGEVLCILNNDIEVITPEWLDELVGHAICKDVGVVGCMLYYPDGTVQHAGVVLGIGGVAGHVHVRQPRGTGGYIGRAGVTQNYTAVTGACMVVRRQVFEQVSGFDEGLPVAFNDVDFCIRVSVAGYFNVWTPFAELYHHESASRGSEDTPEKRMRFDKEASTMKQRWDRLLLQDPAYNPNLTLDDADFGLAFPPRAAPNGVFARVGVPVI